MVSASSLEASFGEPFLGAQVGDFGLLRLIGRGAQSAVFEGIAGDSVRCAVKVVRLEPVQELPESTALVVERLENEARVLERLAQVPGVPRLLAVERSQGGQLPAHIALVMSLSDGMPIGRAVPESALLSWSKTLLLAHRVGVVHGDLAPEHLLLAADGATHVLDWGCAFEPGSRARRLGFRPRYESALVKAGQPPEASSDWFAFERILAETGAGASAPPALMQLILALSSAEAAGWLRAAEALSEVCGLSAVK